MAGEDGMLVSLEDKQVGSGGDCPWQSTVDLHALPPVNTSTTLPPRPVHILSRTDENYLNKGWKIAARASD